MHTALFESEVFRSFVSRFLRRNSVIPRYDLYFVFRDPAGNIAFITRYGGICLLNYHGFFLICYVCPFICCLNDIFMIGPFKPIKLCSAVVQINIMIRNGYYAA